MRNAFVPILVLLALGGGGAAGGDGDKGGEKEADPPALVIFSRLGAKSSVKLYNDESVVFFARPDFGGGALKHVEFVLFDGGGSPERGETVRARGRDLKQWGAPPSSFELPLSDRDLPVGSYRLRATKEGYDDAEIGVVLARFDYVDLKTDHGKTHYKASFTLRLEDVTEERPAVPVTVVIEGPQAGVVASAKHTLRQTKSHGIRESGRVTLSSTAKAGGKALRVVPDSTLVLVLDGLKFRYPIPLPLEEKMYTEFDSSGNPVKHKGRGR